MRGKKNALSRSAQGELASVVPPEFPPLGDTLPGNVGVDGGAFPPRGSRAPSLPPPGRARTGPPSLLAGETGVLLPFIACFVTVSRLGRDVKGSAVVTEISAAAILKEDLQGAFCGIQIKAKDGLAAPRPPFSTAAVPPATIKSLFRGRMEICPGIRPGVARISHPPHQ